MCQPGRPLPHGESHDGSPGLAAFHSAKSAGALLALVDLDARAVLELVERLARQLAVRRERLDREVDVAVDRVGLAVRDQPLDDRDDLGDVVGDLRLDVGRAAR